MYHGSSIKLLILVGIWWRSRNNSCSSSYQLRGSIVASSDPAQQQSKCYHLRPEKLFQIQNSKCIGYKVLFCPSRLSKSNIFYGLLPELILNKFLRVLSIAMCLRMKETSYKHLTRDIQQQSYIFQLGIMFRSLNNLTTKVKIVVVATNLRNSK